LDKYSVKLTSRALRDLDGIYAYIAKTLLEPGMALKLGD
jgi:toxin ParE1/3/4